MTNSRRKNINSKMQFMILKEGERIKRKGYKISEEGENEGVRLEL